MSFLKRVAVVTAFIASNGFILPQSSNASPGICQRFLSQTNEKAPTNQDPLGSERATRIRDLETYLTELAAGDASRKEIEQLNRVEREIRTLARSNGRDTESAILRRNLSFKLDSALARGFNRL